MFDFSLKMKTIKFKMPKNCLKSINVVYENVNNLTPPHTHKKKCCYWENKTGVLFCTLKKSKMSPHGTLMVMIAIFLFNLSNVVAMYFEFYLC